MKIMITRDKVIPMLLVACPSFEEHWQQHINGPIYEEGLLYIHLGEFARHLVSLQMATETEEFEGVFSTIENLVVGGDPYVREAAIYGLLEGIQNSSGGKVDPKSFLSYLQPESAMWWEKLNVFWNGEVADTRK